MSHREPHAATTPRTGEAMGMRGCEHPGACTSERAGHGLNAVQQRLATVAASKWIDAIVTSVDANGFAWLATLDGGIRRVWQHDAFAGTLQVGDPVALHGVYGVLAAGAQQFSVADA
ncbi:hypothetical protein [Agromyces aureus]|uniref:Uncharacterized protein n=1 Tax=Agromyces aureus TaxID=453304 RepID=A0A191WHU0_9MICO|nr:hypothetical protein [Agromyces aureus]ANJ27743.1 hypothetical protein ATC03_14520 [Agromyces aureus]